MDIEFIGFVQEALYCLYLLVVIIGVPMLIHKASGIAFTLNSLAYTEAAFLDHVRRETEAAKEQGRLNG